METPSRADEIRAGLGAELIARQETLNELADAAEAFEHAEARLIETYSAAIKSGWAETDLAKFGVKRPAGPRPARRRRKAAPSRDEQVEQPTEATPSPI